MWYSNSYRRHLCDMHIEDWDDRFMSRFDPEEYVENLVRGEIDSAMIYLQSHVGLCYYPTKSGHMHRSLVGREDAFRRTTELCREKGMTVVGYYSLLYNTVEHDTHADWRMLMSNGKSRRQNQTKVSDGGVTFSAAPQSRYGLCCLNNPDYHAFVRGQIDEMLDYFELDGLFFDMPFWPHTCYCEHCRARYKKEFGKDMPIDPVAGSEGFSELIRVKHAWMGQWVQSITDYIGAKNSELSVEYNFAMPVSGSCFSGCGEGVAKACDFLGGDLYGSIYNHSAACKFYRNITPNHPFDYMFSRCKPALSMHTLTKSMPEIRTEMAVTAAHHGATLVIDAIDPIGTMDGRFYDTLGEAFRFEKQFESYYTGEMVEDVGIYYSLRSKYKRRDDGPTGNELITCLPKTLIGAHIPFGITGAFHGLDGYKVLVGSCLTDDDGDELERILEYVEKGGKLYLGGMEHTRVAEVFLGAKLLGRTAEKKVYLAPKKEYEGVFGGFNAAYPLPFTGSAPLMEFSSDVEVLATLTLPYTAPNDLKFASIHSDPPGIATDYPLAVRRKIGKGEIIFCGMNLETVTHYEYRQIFLSLLGLFGVPYSIESDAPRQVEITAFHDKKRAVLHTVVMNEDEFSMKIAPFEVRLNVSGMPKRVHAVAADVDIPFVFEDGKVRFECLAFEHHEVYVIEF